jgi:hypothetical protein
VWNCLSGKGGDQGPRAAQAADLAAEHRFFHWPLEFPEVFAQGGFDVLLGNPPWETMSPDAKEFFSAYDPSVRFQSPDDQKALIENLLKNPIIAERWDQYRRELYAVVQFLKSSGRFVLFAPGNLGKGDFNVYRMFVEICLDSIRPGGRAGQVVPENFYNGANATAIRRHLFEDMRLVEVLGFLGAEAAFDFTLADDGAKRGRNCPAVMVDAGPGVFV